MVAIVRTEVKGYAAFAVHPLSNEYWNMLSDINRSPSNL